ncbi:Pentatricopeptide repeat-containing protein, partial [Durusdinium trenchii]
VRASWLSRILEDGTKLQYAPEDLRGDREFLLDAVRATKAPWLVQLASKALQEDAELVDQVKREAGTGLVFTWYHSFDCFANMRKVIVATGASVPGGEAYAEVMKKLNATGGGSATVWFDTVPVWGFQANGGKWRHPPTDCGRNDVSVPPPEGRDPMWDSLVESRVSREAPAVGSKHPCWCCHWLRAVRKKVDEGAIICCVVSNIYNAEWVKKYHAGSSEVSDAVADQYKLKREWFRNGRPPNWGEGEIEIHGHDDDDDDGIQRFSRVAPVHPHTQLPLGEGCRWEREALDNLDCTVMAFFMP